MKIIEIIKEEQKQLNEAFPLLTIPLALSALTAFFKVKSIYDIYDFIVEAGKDPENLTEEDYIDLAFDIILLVIPGGGRATREVLKRVTPMPIQKYAAESVKDKIAPLLSKFRTDIRAANKLSGTAKNKARATARKQFTQQAEKVVAGKITGDLAKIFATYGITAQVVIYFANVFELENELEKVKQGEESSIFGNLSYEEASEEFERLKRVERGKLVTSIVAIIAGLGLPKLKTLLTMFIPFVSKHPRGPGLITLLTPIAIPLFLQSELGKKFLADTTVALFLEGIGGSLNIIVDLLAKGLSSITGIGKTDNAAAQQGTQPDEPEVDQQHNIPNILRVYPDRNNPKKINIGGIQFTDDQGYLIASQGDVDRVKDAARLTKLPDPTANMKRKPALQ